MVLTLLILGAMLGFATGLAFRVWAMAPLSLLVAIAAAVVLQNDGVGWAGGVAVIVGCLVVSQFAYLAGSLLALRADPTGLSVQDEVDGEPDDSG